MTQSSFRFTPGFLVNLLNPKTVLWFYAFLPQFVDPARGAVPERILLFGMMFVALAACAGSCYTLLGATLGRWLARKSHSGEANGMSQAISTLRLE